MTSITELIQQYKLSINPVTQSVLRQIVCDRLSDIENFNDYFEVGNV